MGAGDRGWYDKAYAGFDFGYIHPNLPGDFVLVSNTRIYVKRGTQTNLTDLVIGSTEWPLTRFPQAAGTKIINSPDIAPSEPDIDYYRIDTSSNDIPTGNWNNLRFKTGPSTYVPANVRIARAEFISLQGTFQKTKYYANPADPSRDLRFQVSQGGIGTKQDTTAMFNSVGSGAAQYFTVSSLPFNVLSVNFYPSSFGSSGNENRNKYTVVIPLVNFSDERIPSKIQIGSTQYPLSHVETNQDDAVYRTPVIPVAADRISGAGNRSINVQYSSGVWAGQVSVAENRRTVNKATLQTIANKIHSVHSLPLDPNDGLTVRLLNDITVSGGTVLTADEAKGSVVGGLYTGYVNDTNYPEGTGPLGSLNPDDSLFGFLVSYSTDTRNASNHRNKTVFGRSGTALVPSKVKINGVEYTATFLNGDAFKLSNADGDLNGAFIQNGKQYFVNVEWTNGDKLFSDVVLKVNTKVTWNGLHWVETDLPKTDEQINTLIDNKVPQQFRSDANVSGNFFQEKFKWAGTKAQYDAIAAKDNEGLYYTT